MATKYEHFDQLLEQLTDESEPIVFSRLYPLSDLHGEELEKLGTALDAVTPERRRRLMRSLIELAETSFEVNFDAIFRRYLDDADAGVRAAAVDGLWENESAALIGPFLTMLRSDPSPQVRAAAATGLGHYVLAGELEKLDQPVQARILTDLLTVLALKDESVEVRRRALESAAYACLPEVLDAVEVAYYDEDEAMRLSAVVGMGRSCDRHWQSILLAELESPVPAMRYSAAVAAGDLELREAVPLLTQMLHDPDRQVYNASIWALGQIGGKEAQEALEAAYDEADEDAQAAIDEALAEQALSAGDVDFALYDVEGETGEDLTEVDSEDWDSDDTGDDAGEDTGEDAGDLPVE